MIIRKTAFVSAICSNKGLSHLLEFRAGHLICISNLWNAGALDSHARPLKPGAYLNFLTLANVAFKSLFLEASWNSQGQQNLGLAACLDPALKKIYTSETGLKQARQRAFEFFNTNPVASGLIIGVIIKLEEEVAADHITPLERTRMISSLSRAVAAMGDALFWQAWMPLCCLVTVWAVLSLNIWWTPLLLPALFCLPALPLRFIGLYQGYKQGGNIVDLLYRFKIQNLANGIRRIVALLIGASTVILLATKIAPELRNSPGRLWMMVTAVAISVLAFRFLALKSRQLSLWYPIVLVAVASALLMILERLGM